MTTISAQTKPQQHKRRIITALILTAIIVIAIFFIPSLEFAIGAALLLLIGGWEWGKLISISSTRENAIYSAILLASFFLAYHFIAFVLIIGVMWWVVALWSMIRAPKLATLCTQNKFVGGLVGLLILTPCWAAIVIMHKFHPGYLLYGLFWVWSADTGAYLFGHLFGKHKLAPSISPGKTWEGVGGGLLCTLVLALLGGWLLRIHSPDWLPILLLAVVVALASVVGDLFESLMKRRAGVKDSGHWLPGHGGLLDRIDGLTAAMPIFALGILMIHW